MEKRKALLARLMGGGVLLLLLLQAGCASRQPDVVQCRMGGRVFFTHSKTDRSVVVEVEPPLRFSRIVDKVYRGVPIRGYLFTGPDGEVFVTRIELQDFEKITGWSLKPKERPIYKFPPRTIFNQASCHLVRSYTCLLANSVVVAALIKNVGEAKGECKRWDSLESLASDSPELVSWINQKAKTYIKMRCQ